MNLRALGLLVWIALPLAAQEMRDNPQTPREFSRAVAKVVRKYPEVCTSRVRWVVGFDISRSGMGRWSEWARQVVSDLITFVMVDGDTLLLLPFDHQVNPPRGKWPGGSRYPTWPITTASKPAIRTEVADLLLWRSGTPDGTAWVQAVQTALKLTAQGSGGQANLCLVISDRDSSDLIADERSIVQKAQGLQEPGQSLWPVPRDTKPIVLLHAAGVRRPAQRVVVDRYMPPWEPPAAAASRLLPRPAAAPDRRGRVVLWLVVVVLLAVGLLLLLTGLAARQAVQVRWGGRDGDASRQVSVSLATGQTRLLGAAGEATADPFTLYCDGAASEVQRKLVLPDLGGLTATADGLRLRTADHYLVRPAGTNDWDNELTLRRGQVQWLEFRLASQTWLLTRQPVGLQATARGADWRQRVILGGVALLLALLLPVFVRPVAPPPSLPLPAPAAGPVSEPFCQ
ncbi:MAG: hypothetical protein IT204_11480 [Fimbriimonadaceae bacterium]|nr:hypothetical protein [Fimbriimonadaceae bacterium]